MSRGDWFAVCMGTLVGSVATIGGAYAVWRDRQARGWLRLEGEILENGAEKSRGAMSSGYVPRVRYRYSVEGQSLSGTKYRIGSQPLRSVSSIENELQPYPVGARVPVYVNPRRPSDAVLKPNATWSDWVLLIIGTAVLYFAWWG